jgi:hypothetical protein
MKRTALVFFVFAAISSILYAQQQKNKDGMHEGEPIHNGFLKASQCLEFGKDNQSVYAMGLMDGMYMSLLPPVLKPATRCSWRLKRASRECSQLRWLRL